MSFGEKESPGAPKTHGWYKLRASKDHLSYVEHPGLSEGVRQALGNHLSPRILAKGKMWGPGPLPRRLHHSFRFLYR